MKEEDKMNKTEIKLNLTCRLCRNSWVCSHVGKVCNHFSPAKDALSDEVLMNLSSELVNQGERPAPESEPKYMTFYAAMSKIGDQSRQLIEASRRAWEGRRYVWFTAISEDDDRHIACHAKTCKVTGLGMFKCLACLFQFEHDEYHGRIPVISLYNPTDEDKKADDWYIVYLNEDKDKGVGSIRERYEKMIDKKPSIKDAPINDAPINDAPINDLYKTPKSLFDTVQENMEKARQIIKDNDMNLNVHVLVKSLRKNYTDFKEILKDLDDLLK